MTTEWLVCALLMAGAPGSSDVAVGPRADTLDPAAPLDLRTVAESALRTHPRVAGAAALVGAAEAERGLARSALLPSVLASGTATRYEEPMVVAPLHGFDPRTPPAFDETLYRGHASVEYTLFDGGARRARIRVTAARAGAAEAALAGAREAVLSEAVSSYLAVLTARDVRAAHARQVAALEAERARSTLFLAEGTSPRVAVLRAEAALNEARAELESAKQHLRLAVHRLVRVSGLAPERVTPDALVEVSAAPDPLPTRDALLAVALASSPRLFEAREQVAAAETAVTAARSAFLPRVAVSGRYSAFGGATTDPVLEWQAGVQVTYPVFTGRGRSKDVERASALADAARAEAALAERSVADAVDGALVAYRSARSRAEALESAVRQSAEVARIEALALEAGAGVQTEYLRAEAAQLRARAALAEARHDVVEARVLLARATGRLDVDWLTRWTKGVER